MIAYVCNLDYIYGQETLAHKHINMYKSLLMSYMSQISSNKNMLGNKHNTEYFSLVDLTCYESIKCSQEK